MLAKSPNRITKDIKGKLVLNMKAISGNLHMF